MIESAFCVINFSILRWRDGRTKVRTSVRSGHGVSDARLWTSNADMNSNKIMTSETDTEEHTRKPWIWTNIGHACSFVNNPRMSPIFKCQQNYFKNFYFYSNRIILSVFVRWANSAIFMSFSSCAILIIFLRRFS